MAAASPSDIGLVEHIPSLVAILITVITPFALVIGWFVKRLIGRLEADIIKQVEITEDLDNRVTSLEADITRVRTFHEINHPGQQI